jgi:hypothetical protein
VVQSEAKAKRLRRPEAVFVTRERRSRQPDKARLNPDTPRSSLACRSSRRPEQTAKEALITLGTAVSDDAAADGVHPSVRPVNLSRDYGSSASA